MTDPGIKLPGLEAVFGLRKEDPLSFLAAGEPYHSRSPTSALRSSLASTPTPSLSSSRSDPFAFSLNSTDSASIKSWGGTSSSEYDDARSTLSSQHDDRASPQPHVRHRIKHRSARISRNLDTLSAMRGYSDLLPPSAPPRSSSLQTLHSLSSMTPAFEEGTEVLEEPMRRSQDFSMAALEQSLFFRPNPEAAMPDSPATERGFPHSFETGSDAGSIRSYGEHPSPRHPYMPLPGHSRASFSSVTSESSPRSSISTAPTSSYEHLPPSAFGPRARRSLEMAETLPGHFEPRHIEHPLSQVLSPVNETGHSARVSPMLMPSPLPGTPMSLPSTPMSAATPLPGSPPGPQISSLSASGSLRYPCPHCYKRFSRPSSLRIHVFSHTGEKPYVCKVCGRGFSVQSNLRRHGRIHTSQSTAATPGPLEEQDLEESEGEEASNEGGDMTMQ